MSGFLLQKHYLDSIPDQAVDIDAILKANSLDFGGISSKIRKKDF
jgi:hypothetical protein